MRADLAAARGPSTPLVFFAAALLVGAMVFPARAQPDSADPSLPYQHWARVLERFVNDRGQVDFRRLAGDRTDLDVFLEYVSRVSPRSAPDLFSGRDASLAYYINAYNALAMVNVINSGFPHSLGGCTRCGSSALSDFPWAASACHFMRSRTT